MPDPTVVRPAPTVPSPRPPAEAQAPASAATRTVHMIGNAHIDPVWLWRWPEGRAEVRATFASALARLEEYPELVFTANQVLFYEWTERTDPTAFARIREHVRSGRWRVAGGWWVEPDANLPLGESLVRQGLLGQRYLADRFGVVTTVGLAQDSFGHPASLPQVLRGHGLTRYVFLRPGPHELTLPAGPFRWAGPDGAHVTAVRIPHEYTSARYDVAGHLDKALGLQADHGDALAFYGVGNHGGGPTRENLDSIRRLAAYSGIPTPRCSSLEAFFAATVPDGVALPRVTGDLHHHAPGCYSAHSGVKRWMRRAERALVDAERWAVAAGRTTTAALREAWEMVLLNQFHDTLAGTSVEEAYVDARDQLGHARASADRVRDDALQALAARVDLPFVEGTQCYVVFNPVPRRLTRTVELLSVNAVDGPVRVEDVATGRVLPAQVLPATSTMNGWARRLLVRTPVGGLGHRGLRVVPDPAGVTRPVPARDLPCDGRAVLDNGRLRLEIDCVVGRPVHLALAGSPNLLADAPHALVHADPSDTWGHRVRRFDGPAAEPVVRRVRLVEDGPVRTAVRVESALDGQDGTSVLVETYRLAAGARHVDVAVEVRWAHRHAVLKLRWPTRLTGAVARWETAYGSAVRPADGSEQPLHTWVTAHGTVPGDGGPGTRAGLAVLADGPGGGDVHTDTGAADLGVTAARSPLYAWHDPAPAGDAADPRWLDLGEHAFTVRLVPLGDDDGVPVDPRVARAAETLAHPAHVLREGAHPGALPPTGSHASVVAGTASLAALKSPEDPDLDAVVVRVAETSGAATTARLRVLGRTVHVDLGPHALRTLRVPADPAAPVVETDLCEWADAERPAAQPDPLTQPDPTRGARP